MRSCLRFDAKQLFEPLQLFTLPNVVELAMSFLHESLASWHCFHKRYTAAERRVQLVMPTTDDFFGDL